MSATAPEVAAEAPAKKSRLWLIVLLIVLFVMVPLGIGLGWYLANRAGAETEQEAEEVEEAPPAPAIYHAIEPTFVVNLADTDADRYLQVEVQVLTRDPAMVKALETHMPMIRNRLLLLFGQQRAEQLRSREDKERLQAEALAELQAILTEVVGDPGIEAVYFTNFVTQ